MALHATSTTCSRTRIVCVLRSGWGKTSRWFANFRALIMLKCICSGNRARSKSCLGSISPLNSSRKTESKLISSTASTEPGAGETSAGGILARGHSRTRLRGSTRNRRDTQGAGTRIGRGQGWRDLEGSRSSSSKALVRNDSAAEGGSTSSSKPLASSREKMFSTGCRSRGPSRH